MYPDIRIVLIDTTHPGNIGAAARAMKTMGLSQLTLVSPQHYPSAEATARASGADDILAQARVCASLAEAIADCHFVVGTSARVRRVPWPLVEPRACAARLVEEGRRGPVALLFGREHSGLTNEELEQCHLHVSIPANPDYSSLNLAAAVQVLAYELRLAARDRAELAMKENEPPVTVEAMEAFYAHLEQTLIELGFLNPVSPKHLMRRLRRFYNRAQPDSTELNILRGILSAAQGRKLPRPKS